jgi:hypothetical protein
MQQRRPRLGDVLDDYCPRERRVTNHVVVAMIEDDVKQTRCTTCDADHEYKQARAPSPRRAKPGAALQEGSESFEPKPTLAPPARAESPTAAESALPAASHNPSLSDASADVALPLVASAGETAADDAGDEQPPIVEDDGPVHRPLIRATLPRPEGHVPERKEPEFTIRQQGARGGGAGGGGREVDGNRIGYRPPKGQRQGGFGQGGGQSRFGGQRHGGGRGPNGGQRSGGRPEGMGNARGQRQGPGSGRRRGGR